MNGLCDVENVSKAGTKKKEIEMNNLCGYKSLEK